MEMDNGNGKWENYQVKKVWSFVDQTFFCFLLFGFCSFDAIV